MIEPTDGAGEHSQSAAGEAKKASIARLRAEIERRRAGYYDGPAEPTHQASLKPLPGGRQNEPKPHEPGDAAEGAIQALREEIERRRKGYYHPPPDTPAARPRNEAPHGQHKSGPESTPSERKGFLLILLIVVLLIVLRAFADGPVDTGDYPPWMRPGSRG